MPDHFCIVSDHANSKKKKKVMDISSACGFKTLRYCYNRNNHVIEMYCVFVCVYNYYAKLWLMGGGGGGGGEKFHQEYTLLRM